MSDENRAYITARIAVDDDSGCWLWTASLTQDGYGKVPPSRGYYRAHRMSYEVFTGQPIPDGLQLDHLCRTRHCVNPAHLEPVTTQVNTRRSAIAPASVNRSKVACDSGHPFTEDNVYIWRGKRHCRTCRREYARRAKAS